MLLNNDNCINKNKKVKSSLDSRLDKLESRINTRFNLLEKRLDNLEKINLKK